MKPVTSSWWFFYNTSIRNRKIGTKRKHNIKKVFLFSALILTVFFINSSLSSLQDKKERHAIFDIKKYLQYARIEEEYRYHENTNVFDPNNSSNLVDREMNTSGYHKFRHPENCEAIGSKQPQWVSQKRMKSLFPEFLDIYLKRPFQNNVGGMLIEHSFALFYTLRSLSPPPSVIIESGAHKGHTTWLMKQTMPSTRIISISPEPPKIELSGVDYRVGTSFVDFNDINWGDENFDKAQAFVLLDDHQDNFRRIFLEGYGYGFRRFLIDDNWEFPGGDCLSLRWVCETTRKSLWSGWVRDNFNRSQHKQTWEEHTIQTKYMERHTLYYYGFPRYIIKRRNRFSQGFTEQEYNNLLSKIDEKELNRKVIVT